MISTSIDVNAAAAARSSPNLCSRLQSRHKRHGSTNFKRLAGAARRWGRRGREVVSQYRRSDALGRFQHVLARRRLVARPAASAACPLGSPSATSFAVVCVTLASGPPSPSSRPGFVDAKVLCQATASAQRINRGLSQNVSLEVATPGPPLGAGGKHEASTFGITQVGHRRVGVMYAACASAVGIGFVAMHFRQAAWNCFQVSAA